MTDDTTSPAKPPKMLSVDDLDAALKLLAAERRAESRDPGRWLLNLLHYIAVGVVLFACPLGLLVVWFDSRLGWGLLIAAAICSVAFGAMVLRGPDVSDRTAQLRNLLAGTELARAATEAWERRSRDWSLRFGCLFGLEVALVLGGFGWLVHSLIATHRVNPWAIGLIAAASLAIWAVFAARQFAEYKYFDDVSRLQVQFQTRLEKAGAEGASEVAVSSEQVELLGRIESSQVERRVKRAVQELPGRMEQWYSVTIGTAALKHLNHMPEGQESARAAIRDAVDSLSTEPSPPNARPFEDKPDTCVITAEGHDIVYRVSEAKRRITVTDIRPARGGEV